MTHLQRLAYAAVLTAVAFAVLLLAIAIFLPGVMGGFLRQHYWVAIFVLAYLVAPVVGKHMRIF